MSGELEMLVLCVERERGGGWKGYASEGMGRLSILYRHSLIHRPHTSRRPVLTSATNDHVQQMSMTGDHVQKMTIITGVSAGISKIDSGYAVGGS